MKAIMTEEGLLIPKDELDRWGEIVVEQREYQFIISPKSVTQLTYGSLGASPDRVAQLLDDVEAGGAVIDDGESTG